MLESFAGECVSRLVWTQQIRASTIVKWTSSKLKTRKASIKQSVTKNIFSKICVLFLVFADFIYFKNVGLYSN